MMLPLDSCSLQLGRSVTLRTMSPRVYAVSGHLCVSYGHRHNRRCSYASRHGKQVPGVRHALPELARLAATKPLELAQQARAPSAFLLDHLAREVVVPVAVGLGIISILHWIAARAQKYCEDCHPNQSLAASILIMAPVAIAGPTGKLLPFMLATTVLRNLLHISEAFYQKFTPPLAPLAKHLLHGVRGGLPAMDALLMKLYLIIWIPFGCWVFLTWKHIAVDAIIRWQQRHNNTSLDIDRLLLPASSVLSWCAVAITLLSMAHALGINLQPLLAVGGFSGVIIGLATQQLLANTVSGISIFLSRPFVVGELVTLQQGIVNVSGTVERVEPMRTLIRTSEDVLIAIPNKAVAEMVVHNKSRLDVPKSRRLMLQQLKFRIKVDAKAADVLDEIRKDVKKGLRDASNVIDANKPICFDIARFTEAGLDVVVKCDLYSTSAYSLRDPNVQQLLLGISKTLRDKYNSTLLSL